MSWTNQLGHFGSWLGDVTGISDVGDEWNTARADGDLSALDWSHLVWQGVQTPVETAWLAPFRAVFKGVDEYSEHVLEPTLSFVHSVTPYAYGNWKQKNEGYFTYLGRSLGSTFGTTGREDPNRVTVGEQMAAKSSTGTGVGLATLGGVLGGPGQIASLFGVGAPKAGYDPFTPAGRQQIRADPYTGLIAGVDDFVVPLVFDPLNFVGGPVKAVTALGKGAKLVSQADYAKAGFIARKGLASPVKVAESMENGHFAETVNFIGREEDDIAGNLAFAANSRMGISDPAAFAHLANTVKGREDATHLLNVLLGLPNSDASAKILSARYGPGFELTVENLAGLDRPWQRAVSSGSDIISGADDDLFVKIDDYVGSQVDGSELGKKVLLDSQVAFAQGLKKFEGVEPNVQRVLPNESTRMGGRVARREAEMARRAGGSKASTWRSGYRPQYEDVADAATGEIRREAVLTPFRPTNAHPATWFIERPSGMVLPENPDSVNEILAQIREIDQVTGGLMTQKNYGTYILDEWAKASTAAQPQMARGLVAHQLNEIGVGLLAERHRLSPDVARKMFEEGSKRTAAAQEMFRQKGWLGVVLDNGALGILRSPVLQRATPNAVQLWDLRKIDKYFMQEGGYASVWNTAAAGNLVDMADLFNSVFKISVLMRLGYTLRNLTEAAWSLAATGNLGHVIGAVGPERVSTLFNKARKPGARLIERVGVSSGLWEDVDDLSWAHEETEAHLEALGRIRTDSVRRIAMTDVDSLVASGTPEDLARARVVIAARTRLGEEQVTYHGTNDPNFTLDENRLLSTTDSQVMAQRETDKAWQDFEVATYAGGREGLLSPDPRIGKNVYGRRRAQYHGTPTAWEGDHPDPELRGPVLFNWLSTRRSGLVGRGLYTTGSPRMAVTYRGLDNRAVGAADRSQTYTTLWKHFRAPNLFDADVSVRDHPELLTRIDDFINEAKDLYDEVITNPLQVPRRRWDQDWDETAEAIHHRPTAANEGLAQEINTAVSRLEDLGRGTGWTGPELVVEAFDDALAAENVVSPIQRQMLRRMRKMVVDQGEDIDPADVGVWIDDMLNSEQMAYSWNTYQRGHGLAQGLAFPLEWLMDVLNRSGDQAYENPKVRAFLHKYFGQPGESPGDLLSRIEDFRPGRDLAEMGMERSALLANDMISKMIRDEGYDGISHTGGGTGMGSGAHPVVVFLNGEDITVVGEDWLDYDNQKVLAAARLLIDDLYQQKQSGARIRRVNYDRRKAQRGVEGPHDEPGDVGYKEVTQADLDKWMENPSLMAREFGYDPKKPLADANFKRMFQTLEKGKVADAHPVTTYGRTVDLSRGLDQVPRDLQDALQDLRDAGQMIQPFRIEMAIIKGGAPGRREAIVRAANSLGYDRVVLPDMNSYGGKQIVVNPKYVGPQGLERRVEEEVSKLEAKAQVPAVELPAVDRAQRRRERRARMGPVSAASTPELAADLLTPSRARYRANGNGNPSAINPDLERQMADTMDNNGIEEWVDELLTNRARLEAERDQISARLAGAQRRREKLYGAPKPGFGQKDVLTRSKHGADYRMAGPLGGHAGPVWARMTSSDDTNRTIFMANDRAAAAAGQMVATTLDPNHPRFFDGWAGILNRHFRDEDSKEMDPVVAMFLQGKSLEGVAKWATETTEGYEWAQSIGLIRSAKAKVTAGAPVDAMAEARANVGAGKDPETVEEAVAALEMATNLYLPEGPVREAFANGEEVTADFIKRSRRGMTNEPLHGMYVPMSKEAALQRSLGEYTRAGSEKIMRVLGSLPETSIMRHPLFVTLAKDEYVRRVGLAEERKGERLTVKEINQIIHDSRHAAKRDLEKTLFTVVRKSRMSSTTSMRFMFPFMAAWENSMRRWGTFVKDDPSMPIRAASIVTKLMNGMTLVDKDGNDIQAGDMRTDSYLVLPGPAALGKFLPGKWGRAMEAQTQGIQVQLSSLDLIFQGHPGDPGLGPIALVPVAEVLKRKPEFEEFLGWTMPYGIPDSAIEQFMPTWARRVKSLWTEDTTYTNAFNSAYLYEQWKFENGQRDTPPTMDEVTEITKSFYLIRTLTNLTSPFSVKYTNERDFYATKLRQYRAAYEDPREAEARFFTDYPDVGLLVQSLSKNPSGALATEKAYQNLTGYQQEVTEAYAQGDPELAGFIANYGHKPTEDEFSSAVYEWERNAPVGPGSQETFRQVANPEESVREAKINEGWRLWRQAIAQAEASLASAGVPPTSPGYVKVMQRVRGRVAEEVYKTGNTDWWNEYKDPDTSKYFRRAQYFEELTSDSQFMRDHGQEPLMRSISYYLAERRKYAEAVNYMAARGGQRSLSGDLGLAWEAHVQQMKADSPEFAAWIDRFFVNDPVVGGAPIPRAA